MSYSVEQVERSSTQGIPDKKRKEYSDAGVKICCEVEKEG